MLCFWGAAVGAGIGAASDAIKTGVGMAFAKGEAKKQRRWAQDMYQHRYQYTMADMKKAGLNPILAYQQGAGNFGSGASAQAPAGGSSMGSSAAAGVAAERLMQEKKNMKANVKLMESQKLLNELQGVKAMEDAGVSAASAAQIRQETKLRGTQEPRLEMIEELFQGLKDERTLGVPTGKILIWLREMFGRESTK